MPSAAHSAKEQKVTFQVSHSVLVYSGVGFIVRKLGSKQGAMLLSPDYKWRYRGFCVFVYNAGKELGENVSQIGSIWL